MMNAVMPAIEVHSRRDSDPRTRAPSDPNDCWTSTDTRTASLTALGSRSRDARHGTPPGRATIRSPPATCNGCAGDSVRQLGGYRPAPEGPRLGAVRTFAPSSMGGVGGPMSRWSADSSLGTKALQVCGHHLDHPAALLAGGPAAQDPGLPPAGPRRRPTTSIPPTPTPTTS